VGVVGGERWQEERVSEIMSKPIQGKRRPDETEPHRLAEGEYAKYNGVWYGAVPKPGSFLLANMARHTVIEHDDVTISVSPSLLCEKNPSNKWHGYLERGVWREC
jgi:hypothetical protein